MDRITRETEMRDVTPLLGHMVDRPVNGHANGNGHRIFGGANGGSNGNGGSGASRKLSMRPQQAGSAEGSAPRTSLSARVYEEILGLMLSGRLSPGEVFNRRQTAVDLGVSVAPVLEAMLELEAEGLIETLPRKGTRVRVLTLEDLQGQLVVREALECQAARLYCGRPVQRHLDRLLQLAEEIDRSDLGSLEHLKDEIFFHHYLVSLAEVHPLTEAYERVMKLGLLYAIQVCHPNHRAAPKASHVEFVNALTTSDPNEAAAAVRAHVQSGKEALFEQWATIRAAQSPNVPNWLRRQ